MMHDERDLDSSHKAGHHTLGNKAGQAAPGNHKHNSTTLDLTKVMSGVTINGSRGGNAAVADLITKLAAAFGFTDGTTP